MGRLPVRAVAAAGAILTLVAWQMRAAGEASSPLARPSRPDASCDDTALRHAGTALGLTRAQYESFRNVVGAGAGKWVAIPRRVDATARISNGRVDVVRGAAFPPNQEGLEIDLSSGSETLALYLPASCSALAVVRHGVQRVAVRPTGAQTPSPRVDVLLQTPPVITTRPSAEPDAAVLTVAAMAPPAFPVGAAPDRPRAVRANAYDAFDAQHAEKPGFGRYTYVLLTKNDDARNLAVLVALTEQVPTVASATREHDPVELNVYEVPLRIDAARAAGADSTDPKQLLKYYDWDAALALMARACSGTSFCNASQGPLLLTYGQSLHPRAPGPSAAYLVADLHALNARVVQRVIAEMNAAQLRDNSSPNVRVTGLREQLLSALFDAGGVTAPIASIFHLSLGTP